MKYEYNGNLLEEERISLVSQELKKAYPFLSLSEAEEVAMLEGPITGSKSFDMEFKRLYNIILVMQDKGQANVVYKDLLQLMRIYKEKEDFSKYYPVIEEIYRFLMGERDFPYLEEFEENRPK